MCKNRFFWLVITLAWAALPSGRAATAPEHARVTLHVSKRGDHSDGSSWAKAFRTIQARSLAVPDAGRTPHGGPARHLRRGQPLPGTRAPRGRITCWSATSTAAWAPEPPARVVIDSGDPQKGFKSYDWWGPIRAYPRAGRRSTPARRRRASTGTAGRCGTSMSRAAMPGSSST